jgi:tRNA (guanine-N7-)-methyltransferase
MTAPRTTSSSSDGRRRILYGRRKGRPLRPARARLVDDLLPRLRVPVAGRGDPSLGGGRDAAARLDPLSFFEDGAAKDIQDVWLEVGFGAGEHLAAQAEAHPKTGFIGCEPFVNGVAALLARVEHLGLGNIRIYDDDARYLIDRLADASLGRVFVLFPDPWPKSRHARRRFVSVETLDALARVMADGAELRVATDDPVYLRWALAVLTRHPDFAWCAERATDWRTRPADQPATRYEEKARAKGVTPVFLVFMRRPRPRA